MMIDDAEQEQEISTIDDEQRLRILVNLLVDIIESENEAEYVG